MRKKVKIEIKPALPENAQAILAEGRAENEPHNQEVLAKAIADADICAMAVVDGRPACVWGIQYQNLLLGHVYIWLYVTKVAEENEFRFVRSSKIFIENLKNHFRFINGHVLANNPKSAVWLKWLGFTIGAEIPEMKACPFWIGER